jgi:Carboxypeptidase regulatory-like domain/TonB dependent receptor
MSRRCLSLLVLFLMLGISAFAQTSTLSGTVVDPSGALIPGAEVVVKHTDTGVTFRTTTDTSGEFSVPALATGDYSVTVTAKGFKQSQVPAVHLDVGVPTNVQLKLEIGSQAEMVSVEAIGTVLQTQSATVTTTLTGRQIVDLPLVSRDALDMVLFLPGTTTPGRPRSSTINGLQKDAINITLDGINVQDNLSKESDGYFTYIRPRIDAIEEVTVSTSAGGADSTGEGAVQIKFVTRAGTNEYKGSLYEYHRNTFLDSNYWFNNRDLAPDPATGKAPRSKSLLNQFGARVGGPISIPGLFNGKNKLFFFSNYEEYRLPEETLRNRTILSPQAQAGIFQYNTSAGVKSVNLLSLAAANVQTSTMDPVTQALLQQIRDSTGGAGISALTDPDLQRFSYIAKGGQTRRFFTGRIDYNLNAKNSIETSYNYQDFAGLVDFLNNTDPAFPGFPNQGSQGSNRFSGVVAWRSTINSRMVNELRGGLNGGTTLFFPEISPGQFNNQGGFSLGINAAGITSATVSNAPSRRNSPVKQLMDNLSITEGKHNLSVGFTFTQVNSWQKSQNAVPSITMGVDTTDPANAMFNTTNIPGASSTDLTNAKNIYAVLTGRVTAINANAQLSEDASKYVYIGPNVARYQEREQGIYAQDTWRLKPTLTLTLGVRWEIQYPFVPLNQKYSVTQNYDQVFGIGGPNGLFNPNAKGGQTTMFVPSTIGEHAYKTDFSNFAPSVGLAWTPHFENSILKKLSGGTGKTVLRAGYSLAYAREGTDFFSSYLGSNPGGFINANRSISIGNLTTGVGTDTMPVLLRQTSRLGPPAFSLTPVFPTPGVVTDQVNVINPDLKMPYVHSWNLSVQRELTKDTVLEVRYIGNRQERSWGGFQYNETNIVENGMLSEFLLAEANLKANLAAGRGTTFKYFGPGTNTSPLPITLAYFSGIPASQAGDATKYTSTNFASTTWTNTLGAQNPAPFTYVAGFTGNATLRAQAIAAGLSPNFFVVNPDKLGGAFDLANWGSSHYHSGIVEVRRRFSKGLLVSASYALAHGYEQIFTSFRQIDGQQGVSPNAITHSFKTNWIYELPFGRGKTFMGGAGRALDALVGGWAIDGTGRLQSGSPLNFGNVRLVGMTRDELQAAMGPRKTGSVVYYLPQDIIDNTIRAANFDPTSATGFSSQGVPTGRYIAGANNPNCIELYAGQCGGTRLILYGPMFTRFDISAVKRVRITERTNFELRGEALNAFNNIDFVVGSAANNSNTVSTNFAARSSATFGQITSAYQDTSTTNDPGGRLIQLVARFNF